MLNTIATLVAGDHERGPVSVGLGHGAQDAGHANRCGDGAGQRA